MDWHVEGVAVGAKESAVLSLLLVYWGGFYRELV